nr:MAG TPA: hypothetical protein [Bacteriophage sp.]
MIQHVCFHILLCANVEKISHSENAHKSPPNLSYLSFQSINQNASLRFPKQSK